MSEWLKKVVDDVDRQFQELPDWKKRNSNRSSFDCSTEEEVVHPFFLRDHFTELFEAAIKHQKNACAICKTSFKKKTPRADHKHGKPPQPRGLLCHNCNAALGLFMDNPSICEAAAEYLRRHMAPTFNDLPIKSIVLGKEDDTLYSPDGLDSPGNLEAAEEEKRALDSRV